MSLETWKAEFYPIPAADGSIKTNLQAVQHSLKKWKGLWKDNIQKHGIGITGYGNIEDVTDYLAIDADSCALCVKHYNDVRVGCAACPLSRVRSGVRCDARKKGESDSPFTQWAMHHNPSLMIHWLQKAEAALLKDQQRKKNARR